MKCLTSSARVVPATISLKEVQNGSLLIKQITDNQIPQAYNCLRDFTYLFPCIYRNQQGLYCKAYNPGVDYT